jgi:hypothetical protein
LSPVRHSFPLLFPRHILLELLRRLQFLPNDCQV